MTRAPAHNAKVMNRFELTKRLVGQLKHEEAVIGGIGNTNFDLWSAGKANKVIAFDLGISPRTVEIYRANLMTKMSANSLSDLVRMAMTAGILDS